MKKISDITRRDIIDVIRTGFIVKDIEDNEIDPKYVKNNDHGQYEIYMPFSGKCKEIEFLSRIYNLDSMQSTDSRFTNARGDIWQHTVNNNDWDDYWFFSDNRFELENGSDDEFLLKFLCEMIHPAVRTKNCPWKSYLRKFNEILSPDSYELYASSNISGREVFSFKDKDSIEIRNHDIITNAPMTFVGSGSYANVYTFNDSFYDTKFALKRAKKDLNEKELLRFRREYDEMKSLNSPHILKVYCYIEDKNEYVMENMDMTLEKYIFKNNGNLDMDQRKNIIEQLINGYRYLHSKGLFHRDVSFNNVLIKMYDDMIVMKISDFGLVKILDSDLTSENSEFKGSLNDPQLKIVGFDKYDFLHEMYALTLLFTFIIAGKSNFSNINLMCIRDFMERGTNSDREKRFQSLDELQIAAFKCLNLMGYDK